MNQPRVWAGLLVLLFVACAKKDPLPEGEPFAADPEATAVQHPIPEASGIADSRLHPGALWVQEDGGNPAQLYLLGHNGSLVRKVFIKSVVNQDWEDLQRSGDQLYLADIGDNAQSRQQCQVYRFDEPGPLTDTISSVQTIRFRYPDGSRDAEALLVDSSSGDLFIITKRESAARIYRVAAPHSEGTVHVATLAGTLPYGGVTGAAQSPDGKHLLVKTYLTVFHYTRTANESIPDALSRKGKSIAYRAEPQGEAIAFARDGNGFFTLSEIPHAGMPQQLYFYKGNP